MSKAEFNTSKMIKWFIVIGLPLIAFLVPTNSVYTLVVKNFTIVTLFVIAVFGTEVIPNVIAASILPVFYIILEVAPPPVAFTGWTGSVPWMVLGGLLMAQIMLRSGILNRLSYWIIVRTGGSYLGLVFGITFAGIIGHILIPGQAVYPFAFITFGLCVALNYGKSLQSSGIMLTGLFSTFGAHYFIYNPTYSIIQGIAATVGDTSITWFQYLFHNLPTILHLLILTFIVGMICKPKDLKENPSVYAKSELEKMGKMSSEEKKCLLVSILLLLYLMTTQWHGIDASWGFLFAGAMFFLPGINLGTDDDLKNINYGLVIFCASCISIGVVANAIGIGQILADTIIPIIENFGVAGYFAMIFLVLFVGNFVMTPLGLYAALTVPLAQIGLTMGVSVLTVSYAIMQLGTEIILPYEWALALLFFSFNIIDLKSFMKLFGVRAVLSFVFLQLVTIPYWRLIGLIT